jgi:hypothetical protein
MKGTTTLILFISFFLSCKNLGPKVTGANDRAKFAIDSADKDLAAQDSLITLLRTMNSYSLDCSADVYWKIIKRGKPLIPFLIESLTDTTMTSVYNNCKRGKLNVGEVCHFALEEIAEFPAFVVTHIKFDLFEEDGCWNFYEYLFDNRNKKAYRDLVRDFYSKNKFVYSKFHKKELKACHKQYGIEGKYRWKE